ncbi:MAG: hypothetical protein WKF84_15030 [Pyrinomonadaceae bacterium]
MDLSFATVAAARSFRKAPADCWGNWILAERTAEDMHCCRALLRSVMDLSRRCYRWHRAKSQVLLLPFQLSPRRTARKTSLRRHYQHHMNCT